MARDPRSPLSTVSIHEQKCLNGEQKLHSARPSFLAERSESRGCQPATAACIERAKAGKIVCEFPEMIQNAPHLERFLSPAIAELLTLRADCSLVALKPAHSSAVAHFGGLVPA
jgi:hypothetical protein